MKRLFVGGLVLFLLGAALVFSQNGAPSLGQTSAVKVDIEARNPWTNLNVNNHAGDFQFVIVSDRTGGHREKVFSKAVEQINLMQPEFVLSVGDLIEGYTKDQEIAAKEWR